MRVLVEQTRENAVHWLDALDLLGGKAEFDEGGRLVQYAPSFGDPAKITVHTLMGGEEASDWELLPERDMILIGTQDMLLSRALNRGYAASRARWPMQFGLLHTDCLWIFDEIQLMGSGLATTAQLEAFRHLLPDANDRNAGIGHGCRSVWMSATLRPEWLKTVDFKNRFDDEGRIDGEEPLSLTDADHENEQVKNRWNASKPLAQARSSMGDPKTLAEEIVENHNEHRGLTLVVVNTVRRAQELHREIEQRISDDLGPRLVLLHSRFRPPERERKIEELLADPPEEGTICISTQVVEAGVDVDATTLFTELAPWVSLVQRFGRCNRRGQKNDSAHMFWIDLPNEEKDAEKVALPYAVSQLKESAQQLTGLGDVGLNSLPEVDLPFEHSHVIRRRDLIDLFDTTPDLAGNDIEIDRYVREIEETDVRLFWRTWEQPKGFERPPDDKAWRRVGREELCPAPIGEFRKFATHSKRKGKVWRWDYLGGKWVRLNDDGAIYAGQTYLIHASAGGYDADAGWSPKGSAAVTPLGPVQQGVLGDDAYDDEGLSKTSTWQTIAGHTDEVCGETNVLIESVQLEDDERRALCVAARWHDWGKAHEVFQSVLPQGSPQSHELWAKADGAWKTYRSVDRPHFRHELASALGVLLPAVPIAEKDRDLVAYLIAAHHGKVRLSIRSMPNEARPPIGNGKLRRFARGVWDNDELPQVDLGGGVITSAVTLSLEPMEIGLCEDEPFRDQRSWLERALRLRDTLGPFRLAYLEALLRAADWRASAAVTAASGSPTPEEMIA